MMVINLQDNLEPGKVIDQAYRIVRRTYQEINAMKDDLSIELKEIDPRIEFFDEYSYGPKSLHLKEYHIFLFKKKEEEELDKEFFVGVVILFSTIGRYKKVSSGEGPELWICKMETKNIEEKTRPWHIAACLTLDERKNFAEKNLEIGGKIYNYNWKSDEDKEKDRKAEEWSGQFIGYPLTEIKNRTFIKEKIIDKLNI